jgi:dTDP-4-dehydrorhamnose 3,5-epimerase
MEIIKTALDNVLLIKPDKFEDYRGCNSALWIDEVYRDRIEAVLESGFQVYWNWKEIMLVSCMRGVLRGIHWDSERWKLCSCVAGKVYHVVVEPESRQWVGNVLSGENRYMVLVPPKHGNSYQALVDNTVFHYMMSEYYDIKREKVYRWDDFDIDWPILPPILSRKDKGE